ncbi:MAG: discoidin domain-containing protein [Clostridia bacterium]|nr:discoidin domain-containing protein [Clostridia bacterium]
MKKLSLVLALIFVFTCSMLASCDNNTEESSAAESVVSKTESKADASSEAASSEAESSEVAENSSEASSEAESSVADESSDAPAEITGTNIAKDKAYTASQLYQQGGAEVEWNWSDTAPIAYPDEDGKSLTDGVIAAADSSYDESVWAGFHAKCPDYVTNGYGSITIDLGEVTAITGVVFHNGTQGLGAAAGISAPTGVEVFVSEDGDNFTSVGSATPLNAADISCEATEIACSANARYVQVRFTAQGWAFVSEVEVFAAE